MPTLMFTALQEFPKYYPIILWQKKKKGKRKSNFKTNPSPQIIRFPIGSRSGYILNT